MPIYSFTGKMPKIPSSVFIAPSAEIIGDVEIGDETSIWHGAVVRGDVHYIRIGCRTNIQDHSVLHVTRVTHPLILGDNITVGHRVTLHGCTVGNKVLIGMGAIILDGAVIGEGAMIGAGSLVTEGAQIPPGVLAFGSPAKVKRDLTPEELAFLTQSAQNYIDLAEAYRRETTVSSESGGMADAPDLGSGG